jgi:hypothetical protein
LQHYNFKYARIIIDTGITAEGLKNDLQNAIYMLHFLQEGFTQREIRDVCHTLEQF